MTKKRENPTRAEKIRERRDKKHGKPNIKTRGKSEMLSRQMPPVMVRGSGYFPTLQSRKERKSRIPKRRVDIELATPGVEIRLPSMPAVRLGWRILSLLLVGGLLAIIYYFWTSPNFQVKMADVKGAQRLSTEEVNRTLNIYNKPVFVLNPRQLEKTLRIAYPELKDINVHVGFPSNIVVHISERFPLIEWNQDSTIQWIDGDGYAFPPRGDVDKLVSVQAYASPPKPVSALEEGSLEYLGDYQVFMQPEFVAGILVMRSQAPEGTELAYDPVYGLGWKDPGGWDVFFGQDGSDIEPKLVVYKSIVEKLQASGVTPVVINVEHLHAPYYRLEQ